MGVSNASEVITGNTIGKGDYKSSYKRAVTFLAMAIILRGCSGVVIFSLKYIVIDSYNISDYTKSIAYQLMNSTSVLVVFMSVATLLTKGVLRAGGDTKFLMIADVLFLWIISIPLGYVAGIVLELPPGIVLIVLKSNEILKGIWCVFRLFRKKWIRYIDYKEKDNKDLKACVNN